RLAHRARIPRRRGHGHDHAGTSCHHRRVRRLPRRGPRGRDDRRDRRVSAAVPYGGALRALDHPLSKASGGAGFHQRRDRRGGRGHRRRRRSHRYTGPRRRPDDLDLCHLARHPLATQGSRARARRSVGNRGSGALRAPMSRERARSGLKRELGMLTTTLFTAAMIVGTGILAASGAATHVAGGGILVAMLRGLLAILVGLLALYSGAAVGVVNPANLGTIVGDKGALGLLAGAAIFFWSWDGFMRAAIMTSEVKDPRRAIPIGIVGGVAIAAVVFLTVGAITLGVLGADVVGGEDTPLLAAGRKAADWVFWVVLAAAIVATLVDMLGVLLT